MNASSYIKAIGAVRAIIEYENGKKITIDTPNTVLTVGRSALINTLINNTAPYTNLYVSTMVFGDNGVDGSGTPKIVSADRTGLYGPVQASKPVVSTANIDNPAQAIFTSVLTYSDANGLELSEMALVLNSGVYYSMVTFPTISKTSSMQITWNWAVTMV